MLRLAIAALAVALAFAAGVLLRQADAPAPEPVAAARPDPAPPAAVVAERQRPSFDVVRARPDAPPVMAGRAEPGARLEIRNGQAVIGTATADRRGEWTFVADVPLGPGAHELTVVATAGDGTVLAGGAPVVLVLPHPGEDTQPILAFKAGPHGAEMLQGPGQEAARDALSIDSATQLGADGIFVAGRGPVGARLRLRLGDLEIGSALADGAGRWRIAARVVVKPGRHVMTAERLLADGGVAATSAVALEAGDTTAFADGTRPVVVRGPDGWRIERREGVTTIFRQ